jgi:hypothetical protein
LGLSPFSDQHQLQVLASPGDAPEGLDLALELARISLVDAEAVGVVFDLAQRDDVIVAIKQKINLCARMICLPRRWTLLLATGLYPLSMFIMAMPYRI